MPLPYPIGDRVDVYRDSELWAKHTAWFTLPLHKLQSLFVCRYNLPVDTDGDYCGDWAADSDFLLGSHPDCIFIYAAN